MMGEKQKPFGSTVPFWIIVGLVIAILVYNAMKHGDDGWTDTIDHPTELEQGDDRFGTGSPF